MSNVRLFVGVELCDEARRVAERAATALRTRLGSSAAAKWVEPANLHVTVRFIGHVDDVRAPEMIRAVTAPIDVPAFTLKLGTCGVFPPKGQPRVIWIGLADGVSSLASLHAELNRRLAPFGFEPESRPFSAHLTLARVRETTRGAGVSVRDLVTDHQIRSVACRVGHATLFRSHLSPAGARYESVARIDLAYS
jgi:RNA 2',3'-cyclic 3'-phosphodiesterase